jgi:signal peptide peptidase SppA
VSKQYVQILTKIRETPWLITPESLSMILDIVHTRMNGRYSDEELSARLEEAGTRGSGAESAQASNGVGIIPVYGPIFGKANLMTELSGATSMEAFRKDFKAMLADDNIKSILLDFDSPGGTSEMIAEAASEIRAGRDIKPVYGLANNMAGSAAYYLMSQTSHGYVTPSGSVGSIGVYTVHEDQSGADKQAGVKYTFVSAGPFKTEGNPHEPLSAAGEQYKQEIVNEIYDEFLSAVALGRGTSVENVKDNFGGGRMLTPKKAMEAGMVDGIMEYDALLETMAEQAAVPHRVQVRVPSGNYANGLNDTTNYTTAFALLGEDGAYHLEVADKEHSEPGTGNPPVPRQPETKDAAIEGGWRRDPLPIDKDQPGAPQATTERDNAMNEDQLKALYAMFGVDSEDKLMAAITKLHSEASSLQSAVALSTEEQKLQKDFPMIWEQIQKDREVTRHADAKAFVESVSSLKTPQGDQFVDTKLGLSALVKDTLNETHMKFANGTASLADFENAVKLITSGGVVPLGESGSSLQGDDPVAVPNTTTAEGVAQARQMFAAKVSEIQTKDSLTYEAALDQAARQYPELAAAYRTAVPA